MSYFDSAFLAKFYLDEPESESVRGLATQLGRVHCSLLGRLEVASVFHRKRREGAFSDAAYREINHQFADDCAAGLWIWLPITAAIIESAAATLTRLPKTTFLRSADLLHIVTALEHGLKEIYSNDRHLLVAAKQLKLRIPGI